jgi:hypothetical protein
VLFADSPGVITAAGEQLDQRRKTGAQEAAAENAFTKFIR